MAALIALVVMVGAAIICWLFVCISVPQLRKVHPGQFALAGSPSPWTWSLLSIRFLRYLLEGQFVALPDRKLVGRLKLVRSTWVASLLSALVLFGALLLGQVAA